MKTCKRNPGWFGLVALLLAGCLLSLPVVAQSQGGPPADARQELMQALPGVTSDYWRDVKGGVSGTTSSTSPGADTLIMVEGETWREWRNNWISPGGLIALGGSASAIFLFWLLVGQVKLDKPRTGRKIERWSRIDRTIHWYVASLFIILAVTGFLLLYAKWFLAPILPNSLWAGFMIAAKNIHNYLGPLFALGLLVMIIKWMRHNVFNRVDLKWFAKGGGIVGKGHPSAGFLNGGEKVWYWLVTFLGLTVVISGLVLDFPNFGQSRETMQTTLIIHAIGALILMAASFGHIYIGTAGTEGAFEGMKTGYVDEAWAEQHHDLWYEAVKHEAISEEELEALKAGQPAAAEAKT
ncbi:formate dehydrogenase gamma subunit [Marinospirillum celere]|uniref:Formate dehydrogenase gamma subunit n=1 Tax=Marinospirillum celere TaxID=1122252 RepID=A0A1I1I516_9GAMM|nr:formate dehydrogenase subunit gamma [Marinospirillum celere]SFC28783.1 formate dehydrogenase gamma subunit [Marinospirillum celere]